MRSRTEILDELNEVSEALFYVECYHEFIDLSQRQEALFTELEIVREEEKKCTK